MVWSVWSVASVSFPLVVAYELVAKLDSTSECSASVIPLIGTDMLKLKEFVDSSNFTLLLKVLVKIVIVSFQKAFCS